MFLFSKLTYYDEASNMSFEVLNLFYLHIIAFTLWSLENQEQESSICNTVKKFKMLFNRLESNSYLTKRIQFLFTKKKTKGQNK